MSLVMRTILVEGWKKPLSLKNHHPPKIWPKQEILCISKSFDLYNTALKKVKMWEIPPVKSSWLNAMAPKCWHSFHPEAKFPKKLQNAQSTQKTHCCFCYNYYTHSPSFNYSNLKEVKTCISSAAFCGKCAQLHETATEGLLLCRLNAHLYPAQSTSTV